MNVQTHDRFNANQRVGAKYRTYVKDRLSLHWKRVEDLTIKFDSRMHETGRIYLEAHQKLHWSGTQKTSKALEGNGFLVIGNYAQCFIFRKAKLRTLCESGDIETAGHGTSKGYLLPLEQAHEVAQEVLDFNLIDEQYEMGTEQLDLF